MESTISGYCRVQDSARLVILEQEGGTWVSDCEYESCVYRANCPIGKQITEIRNGGTPA